MHLSNEELNSFREYAQDHCQSSFQRMFSWSKRYLQCVGLEGGGTCRWGEGGKGYVVDLQGAIANWELAFLEVDHVHDLYTTCMCWKKALERRPASVSSWWEHVRWELLCHRLFGAYATEHGEAALLLRCRRCHPRGAGISGREAERLCVVPSAEVDLYVH